MSMATADNAVSAVIGLSTLEIFAGVIILFFALAGFFILISVGLSSLEKRGVLFIFAGVLILSSYFFELLSNIYKRDELSLVGHGFVITGGLLLIISFYLSKKAIEKSGGESNDA